MTPIDALLTVAQTFTEAQGLKTETVSWRVFGDSKKIALLIGGADLGTRRHAAAMLWFATNWPADLAWPEGIDRPAVTENAG